MSTNSFYIVLPSNVASIDPATHTHSSEQQSRTKRVLEFDDQVVHREKRALAEPNIDQEYRTEREKRIAKVISKHARMSGDQTHPDPKERVKLDHIHILLSKQYITNHFARVLKSLGVTPHLVDDRNFRAHLAIYLVHEMSRYSVTIDDAQVAEYLRTSDYVAQVVATYSSVRLRGDMDTGPVSCALSLINGLIASTYNLDEKTIARNDPSKYYYLPIYLNTDLELASMFGKLIIHNADLEPAEVTEIE